MVIEILRRLVLAACVIVGATMICHSPSYLYSVEPVDWRDKICGALEREKQTKRLMGKYLPGEDLSQIDLAPEAKKGLEDFIAKETKGRLYRPSSKEWTGVFVALADLRHGRLTANEWQTRKGRVSDKEYYFSDSDRPFNELQSVMKGDRRFLYIQVGDTGNQQYLAVTKRTRQDLMRYAPGPLAYPYRRHGFFCLLLGSLAYWLIPWPKVRRESLRYSRPRSAVLPDVVAAFMFGMFFSLPILIANSNGAEQGAFSPGWAILTAIMWLFAMAFGAIWGFTAFYTTFSLEFLDDQLKLSSWRSFEVFPASDIVSVTVKRIDPQNLNRALLWISLFVSWRATGSVLSSSGPEYGLFLVRRNGRQHRIPLKGAGGVPQAIGRLARIGVPIDPSVYELIGSRPTSNALAAPFPSLGTGLGASIAGLSFSALFAWLVLTAGASEPLSIAPAKLSSKPYTEPKSNFWVPSPELVKAEREALSEVERLQSRMKELEQTVKSGSPAEQKAAAKESEELLKKAMDIHEQLEKMRKDAGAPY